MDILLYMEQIWLALYKWKVFLLFLYYKDLPKLSVLDGSRQLNFITVAEATLNCIVALLFPL